MGIVKQYSRATQSSNLRSDDRHHDTDKLAAVALSGPMGSMLFRVKYAFDATSYPPLKEAWRYQVRLRASINGWPEHVKDQTVADEALAYWLNDQCPACAGRSFMKMEFVDVLSDVPCPICLGSGKKPLIVNHRIKGKVAEMVDLLDTLTIEAGSAAVKKLADDMDGL